MGAEYYYFWANLIGLEVQKTSEKSLELPKTPGNFTEGQYRQPKWQLTQFGQIKKDLKFLGLQMKI